MTPRRTIPASIKAADMRHVVALSGGKDSTALALRLAEVEPRDYEYVCTPTGDELPDMIEHWKQLGELLGKPIKPVTSGYSLQGLIRKWNMLPNHRARWCTRVLKIEPYYAYLKSIAPAISYVGLRADEESRQGMQFPELGNIQVRFPMQEWGWGLNEVWRYLEKRGVEIPTRTDCGRCYHQRLGEWYLLWRYYLEIYLDAEREEAATGHTFRSPQRDSWPADLKSLRLRFERGDVPRGAETEPDLFETRQTMCRVCSL